MQHQNSTTALSSIAIGAGLEPYTGEWGDQQIIHLLRRTLFGVKKENLNQFRSLDLAQAIEAILQYSPIPDPPVNDYYDDTDEEIVGDGKTWINEKWNVDLEGYRIGSLKRHQITNMIGQEATIQEKMMYFWHNHIPIQYFEVFDAKNCYRYTELLREKALGNFKEMVYDMTISPSMLIYLNLTYSNKWEPDENYARELQELFCIGKGSDSKYTEQDVQAVARALTGWRVKWEDRSSYFDPNWHDENDKQFSSFYGSKTMQGRSGMDGMKELDDILDMIFEANETAKYICRKLYSFFVQVEITEEAEVNVIEPLAVIFRDNNYNVKPVLEALFGSAHFYELENIGAMIKNPIDFVVGHVRLFDIQPPVGASDSDLFSYYGAFTGKLWGMGMDYGDPPNVAGWAAYYQKPLLDKFWVNTGSIIQRASTMDATLYWGLWHPYRDRFDIHADLTGFIDKLDNPSDPEALVEEIVAMMLAVDITAERKEILRCILLSGQKASFYWTDAWTDFKNKPNDETARSVVENRLKWFFQNLAQFPEYHLM